MTGIRDLSGIRFVRFSPGKAWIGNEQESAFDDALRPFCVQLTRPFWVSALPVTQGTWHGIMGDVFHSNWMERLKFVITSEGFTSEKLGIGQDFPMHMITYEEALTFTAKLSRAVSIAIRLPTEAEWELAAQSAYGFDNSNGKGIALSQEMGWFNEGTAASRMMRQVGLRPDGNIDVRDMYGLVWEFVRGRYRSASGEDFDNGLWPDCYPARGHVVNDFEPACVSSNLCVAKGGSIYSEAKEIASGQRIARAFAYYTVDLGFRLAIDEGEI